ncbi:hypothetical protein AQUCO_00300652v1 [Aquilegia coerulea]|uniref:Uncharacterized protein n=1 Tax=Aquilegia coerulea TaxID=218851 RepID=A0A2G5EZW0_AQUCA|nr:hypothetical protein AQUCO_00300652v1 [Aquilegia coerulea]
MKLHIFINALFRSALFKFNSISTLSSVTSGSSFNGGSDLQLNAPSSSSSLQLLLLVSHLCLCIFFDLFFLSKKFIRSRHVT